MLYNLLQEHNLCAFPSAQTGAGVHACLETFHWRHNSEY